ncbi:histidine phosphatase family protein [Rhodoferax sp. U2-2l]|uniref:histidine phosphatase family protein n=1 Tax=Rhodoferax sp. U2-2l TaxID=2884000 RepID=UPI001D09C6D7|nr:histidine phosphatase family protein [Rhodoferax sp. U2-2l]MCB8746776.1 histidine phosphatase family protein [Rhodoferax sp. U2-2l]
MQSTQLKTPGHPSRRWFLLAGAAAAGVLPAQGLMAATDADRVSGATPALDEALRRLRGGGVVVMFRHALAPGTFDPPEFKVGDCRTQRNLNAAGRAQAQRIGRWFARHGLTPESVRASPWCRCLDTATLAFGTVQPWDALASPVGSEAPQRQARTQMLQAALHAAAARPGFQVWVTHDFVVSDLTGSNAQSGEGLVLQADAAGDVQIVARLTAMSHAPG